MCHYSRGVSLLQGVCHYSRGVRHEAGGVTIAGGGVLTIAGGVPWTGPGGCHYTGAVPRSGTYSTALGQKVLGGV